MLSNWTNVWVLLFMTRDIGNAFSYIEFVKLTWYERFCLLVLVEIFCIDRILRGGSRTSR